MGWAEFIAAFAIFFISHSIPIRPPVKTWLVSRIGSTAFSILYSAMSLAILWWLIVASGRAPFVQLWPWAPWQSELTIGLMLLDCLILAFTVAKPNPFSFGGAANHKFDPDHAGIVRLTRHPLLVVLALWALAHVIPNGDLAHVVLFGSFATFAAFGGRLVDRRRRREMGADWEQLLARVHRAPLLTKPNSYGEVFVRFILGAGLFLSLIWLHPSIIGVTPLP